MCRFMFKKFSRKSKVLTVILSAMSVVVLTVSAFFIFVSDYYHSDTSSINAYISEYNVTKKELYDGATSYSLESNDKGFVFYPGGKVEHTAYEPLMYNLASKGITCILIRMPFNLAFFNVDAASKVKQYFPDIKSWYIGGHSLGGSIASSYVEKNHEEFDGLILLASYSINDLRTKDINILTIYGNEDKVLKYLQSLDNYDIDLDFMNKVVKRRNLEELIDKYVISNSSKELKMLYDTVKANLFVMVKVNPKTIDNTPTTTLIKPVKRCVFCQVVSLYILQ